MCHLCRDSSLHRANSDKFPVCDITVLRRPLFITLSTIWSFDREKKLMVVDGPYLKFICGLSIEIRTGESQKEKWDGREASTITSVHVQLGPSFFATFFIIIN
jgi:hypothetical protein